jgi:hypothetical protein
MRSNEYPQPAQTMHGAWPARARGRPFLSGSGKTERRYGVSEYMP